MQQQTLEYQQTLDARFEAEKAQILSSESNWQVSGAGKVYYVSPNGSDANDGLSPERAWATVGKVNATAVAEGSVILFERGGVWNCQGSLLTKKNVTFSAYGTGEKPLLSNGADANDPSDWTRVGENLWVYSGAYASAPVEGFANDPSLPGSYLTSLNTPLRTHEDALFVDHPRNQDVGCVILDGGKRWGVKITKTDGGKTVALGTVWNGAEERDYPSVAFQDERDLTIEGTFYHNPDTSRLYFCCTENPATKYGSVKLVLRGYGVLSGADGSNGTTFDNLAIKYFGAHGISVGGVENFTVRNCELGWLGGSIQIYGFLGRDYPTRFGEGIQNWGACDGYYIQNSWIYQIYDGAVSSQRSVVDDDTPLLMQNIQVTDCLFEYNTASVEMWLNPSAKQAQQPDRYGFVGMRVTGNLFRNIGYGFGNTRPGEHYEDTAYAITVGDGYQGEPGLCFHDCLMTDNVMWNSRKLMISGLYWSMERGQKFYGNTILCELNREFAQLPADFEHFKEWDYARYTYSDEVIGLLTEKGFVGSNDFYYLDPTVR